MNIVKELDYILEFTKVYQSESDRHLREAKCLKLQTTAILAPLVEDDLIAGRMQHHWVGFSPQYGGLYTYFFHNNKVEEALRTAQDTLAPEYIQQVRKAYDFWQQEKTVKRLQDRYLESYDCLIPVENTHNPGIGNADCRLAGTTVDLDKLIRLGLPGLRAEISKFSAKSQNNSFYQALDMTIDTIADACAAYEKQAREFYQKTGAIHFEKMANALCNIQTNCPKTFQEGLQLMWVYAMISDLMNYGRMDVYLGDLYVHDRNNNLITEEEAIGLITSVYRHMLRVNKIHDSRVIIGGRGRRNEKNADELALIIMEVSRRFKQVVPQLTMRYYHGMDERLFDKALKVNAEGTTFPIIYSDDTNIPAVQKVYGVTKEEAQQYVPFGCGEYVLEGLSLGTPNNGINLLKALEVTLHRGMDMYWNIRVGKDTGALEEFDTFEKLWDAYSQQLKAFVDRVALYMKLNYSVAGDQAGYLHISL